MEWITIEDKEPPKESSFLGTDGKIIFAAYWNEDCDFYQVGGWERCNYCGGASNVSLTEENYKTKKVTHWMPLPELPKD